jgi:hypothetical protein
MRKLSNSSRCQRRVNRLQSHCPVQAARSHVAQAAWNPYCKDDQFIGQTGLDERRSRDLADWIVWQRRYQSLKSAGKSDQEAFDLANGRATITRSGDADSPSAARLPMMKR